MRSALRPGGMAVPAMGSMSRPLSQAAFLWGVEWPPPALRAPFPALRGRAHLALATDRYRGKRGVKSVSGFTLRQYAAMSRAQSSTSFRLSSSHGVCM